MTCDRDRVPILLLVSYLAAITIFGKGPTYLGVGIVYWGEAVLAVLLTVLYLKWTIRRLSLPFVPVTLPISLFVLLGVLLTIRDFPIEGLTALRDAAIWYYALFFFVGLALATRKSGERLWELLQVIWVLAMVWTALNLMTGWKLATHSPFVPEKGIPVLSGSGSENIQHLFLGALIVFFWPEGLRKLGINRAVMSAVAIVSAGLALTHPGRGAKVSILLSFLVVVLVASRIRRSSPQASNRLLPITLVLLAVCATFVWQGPTQIADAAQLGRFSEVQNSALVGTARWRTIWWQEIFNEVGEEDPLIGLGFGYDLQNLSPLVFSDPYDHFQLRSPHNINMTIFARMGTIGLLVWAAILVLGLGSVARAARHQWIAGSSLERSKEMLFWLAMLVATWINSSFGVLMEGPVLGVWFWFALGFASGRSVNIPPRDMKKPVASLATQIPNDALAVTITRAAG